MRDKLNEMMAHTARKAQKKLPVFLAQKKPGVFFKKLPVFLKKLPAAKKLPVFFYKETPIFFLEKIARKNMQLRRARSTCAACSAVQFSALLPAAAPPPCSWAL
jgi:hypothetical protein